MTIHVIPIHLLDVAPENARFGRPPENVEALAANIRTFGLLTPLGVYQEGKRFKVFAGARRLHALQMLGDVPTVDCVIRARSEAAALSIAENHQRVDMRPAEAARAWSKMIADGADVAQVARAFGVTERFVQQRVKLAALHPPIAAALDAGDISLDVAGAFANATTERQAEVWRRMNPDHGMSVYQVRRALQDQGITSVDRVAVYVGEDAYVAAGGRIERDLFGAADWADDVSYADTWLDADLARRLAEAKLEAEAERFRKQGFGFVRVGIEPQRQGLDYGAPYKTKAEKQACGVILYLTHNGSLQAERGVTEAKAKGSGAKAAGKPASAIDAGGDAPARELSNAGWLRLSEAAGRILGNRLAERPRVALVALAAHLARMRWGSTWNQVLTLGVPNHRGPFVRAEDRVALRSDAAYHLADRAWEQDLLPLIESDDAGALERHLGTLTPDEIDALIAHVVGGLVDTSEATESAGHALDDRRQRATALLALADLEPEQDYAPSGEDLAAYSKDALERFAGELSAPAGKTKAALATAVAIAAAPKGWVPPIVRDILQAPPPAPPEPAKKRSRGK